MPGDADHIKAFFTFLFEGQEGFLCITTINRVNPDPKTKVNEKFFRFPDKLNDVVDYVYNHRRKLDVYFCPTLLVKPKRIKENIVESRVVWSDLDECIPDNLLVEPTLVIESSVGRYQGFWVLNETYPALDIENVNKRIAYYHENDGADLSGWDLTQLLRIPLTFNHKYIPANKVTVFSVEQENLYSPDDFSVYPGVEQKVIPLPSDLPKKTPTEVLGEYKMSLNPRVHYLFNTVPEGDWSQPLWELEKSLLESGLPLKEAFIVCRAAACNKYRRDGRPETHLWKELVKALEEVKESKKDVSFPTLTHRGVQDLLTETERYTCKKESSFIEEYVEWGKTVSDAAWQYHQAGAFIILSSILSGCVSLPTSFGTINPNLWFMILADTTLTRKSTAMDMAVDMLTLVNRESILATDSSIEGLLTALSTRPGTPSLFLRDEFTGFIEQMARREYYSGMLETFTKLYDGKFMRRVLRKETIEVADPIFILFAGGIKSKMTELLSYEHVSSGFLPRFVIITAEADVSKIRPLGPPTETTSTGKQALIKRLLQIQTHYIRDEGEADANSLRMPKKWNAELTPDAWGRYNKIESTMMQDGIESGLPELMTPTMDRLAKSGLKAAILIAASDKLKDKVVVEEEHLVRAFYYVEQWREHVLYLVNNLGSTGAERQIQRAFAFIKQRPGTPRSELMKQLKLDARQAASLFSTLEQRALIKTVKKGKRDEAYYAMEG